MNRLSVLFGVSVFVFSSAASAGGYNWNYPGQGNCNGGSTCGELTVTGNGWATATHFYSDLYSGASAWQQSNLISTMQADFNYSPFTNYSFTLDRGTLNVANLGINQKDIVTYTFLGASAYDTNTFTVGSNSFNNQSTAFGTQFTQTVTGPSPLSFAFADTTTHNGGLFGILHRSGGYDIGGTNYAALLLFNDSGSTDGDFNDMVIGVNSQCVPVPEPSEYALMASGLGLIGFIAASRKKTA
jgi:hypothetical protein